MTLGGMEGFFFVVFRDFQFSKKMVIIVQRKEETSRNFIYLSTPLPLVHRLFSDQQSKVVAMIGVFHVTLTFLVTTLGRLLYVVDQLRWALLLIISKTFSKFQIRKFFS